MRRLRNLLMSVALLLCVSSAHAQYATQVTQSNILTASGASAQASISTAGLNIGVYKINWFSTATVSACTIQLQYSSDNSSFSSEGAAQTCTSSGEFTVADNTARNYFRVNFTALTVSGGGSVKYVLSAPVDSLNSTNVFSTSQAGVVAASGASFNCASGLPDVGTSGTNTTGIAHQLWGCLAYFPHAFTVTNLAVLSGGTSTTDKIALGIWSLSGTLLADTAATDATGTTLSGANTFQSIALTAPYTISAPGWYILGVVTSGTTAGDIQTYALAKAVYCVTAASGAAQGTLATFTPAFATTISICPYMTAN